MKILGYSERGIINSLIFSIGDDIELMNAFIDLIKIREIKELKSTVKDYTILLEQSFSRFGDADLVIIIEYENPEDNKVLFIEGKVKTSQSNWIIQSQFDKYTKKDRYNGYSSNLFFQLHLKKLLFDNCKKYEFEKGIIEPKFEDFRKIGENKVVLKALKKIKKCKEAYYIGLIPSTKGEIKDFKNTKNDLSDFIDNDDLRLHFISWKKVEKFCKKHNNPESKKELIHPKLNKVLKIFKYNKGQIYKRDKITVQTIKE